MQASDQGLCLRALSVTLNGAPLITVDANVAPGEVLTVMGPSGAGKSTLLAAIAGTLAPAFGLSGSVRLDGRDITTLPTEARQVGILFQDDLLFAHLSVAGNLAFGLPAHVRGRQARRARVEAALADIGLAGFGPRDPATLSGGQRARVALMRMLLSQPRALLLDEPFAKLDLALRGQIRDLVFATVRRQGLPVLQVTHDPADAEAAGGRVHRL